MGSFLNPCKRREDEMVPFMKTFFTFLIGLMVLAICSIASADIILYEGFDCGESAGGLSGKAGSTSSGFLGGSTWTSQVGGPATYETGGLSFGNLVVTGGDAQLSHDEGRTSIARQIGTSYTGTLWGSYLFQCDAGLGDGKLGTVMVRQWPANGNDNTGEFNVYPDVSNGSLGGLKIKDNTDSEQQQINTGDVISIGTTYLSLFKFTNLGGSSGDVVGSNWILTSDQYNNFKSGGLTEAELTSASTGTASNQVLQKTDSFSVSPTVYPRFQSGDYLQMVVATGPVTYKFDELRISDTSLDEAAPAVPEPSLFVLSFSLPGLVFLRKARARKGKSKIG